MATHVETVRPASARRETIAVATACVGIVIAASLVITVRGRVEAAQELAEYQISAYDGLDPTAKGVYNDLLTASLDIDLYHADTLRWPSVEQLQGQYIAPFVRDLSWQQRGALEWRQDIPNIEMQHTVAYYALSQKPDTTGSFLLWMTHKHNMTGPMADAFMAQRGEKQVTQGPGFGRIPGADISDMGMSSIAGGASAAQPPKPAGTGDAQRFKPQVRIWFHPQSPGSAPSVYQDEQLIRAGWREVIARTGTEETQRLQGNSQ